MNKPIVLIDVDGVLADFDSLLLELAAGYNLKPKLDGNVWDLLALDELKDVKHLIWDRIINSEGLIRGIKKYNYAIKLVNSLREIGEVIACTSSAFPGRFSSERIEWLMEELSFDRKDIIICYKKHLVRGDFLIDDKPENVIDWQQSNSKTGKSIFWKTPGRNITLYNPDIFSTGDVDEAIEFIKSNIG